MTVTKTYWQNTNIEEIYEYASERSERDFRASLENVCIFTF